MIGEVGSLTDEKYDDKIWGQGLFSDYNLALTSVF